MVILETTNVGWMMYEWIDLRNAILYKRDTYFYYTKHLIIEF